MVRKGNRRKDGSGWMGRGDGGKQICPNFQQHTNQILKFKAEATLGSYFALLWLQCVPISKDDPSFQN